MGKYFDFTRLATRSEFWQVFVANIVLSVVLFALMMNAPGLVLVWMLGFLALAIAVLATLVSRIRDTGNNVLWILACLIPYIGFVAWIVFGCLETAKAKK